MAIGRICLRPTSPAWTRTPASTDRYSFPASLSCLIGIHEKIFLHLFCLENTQQRQPLDSCLGVPWMKGSFVSTAPFCIGCETAVAPQQETKRPSDLKAAAKGMELLELQKLLEGMSCSQRL